MNKKKLFSFLTAIFLLYTNKSISLDSGYSKKYHNGVVYIGNREYLENIDNINDNDILVLDARDDKDPDMKVLSSYLIRDIEIQNEILKILLEYEETYPSGWDRSIDSMQMEWIAHNLMSYFSYKSDRTDDVDFNNSDEEKYKILKLK